ncbi:hypothetical protein FRC01_000105 [Tulasnella sp. 417]|nr:hypothetical protein FRC01_000105 [Tulasnella sp. 417]
MASEKAKKGPSKRHLERKRARGIATPEANDPPSNAPTPEIPEPTPSAPAVVTEPQVVQAYAPVTILPAVTVLPTVPPPFIHDPGNGPRVLDVSSFLHSPFAEPACTTDPRCYDLGAIEVYPILHRLLPPDVALIVYYNVTRQVGRICPACRRIYRVGDELQPHLLDGKDRQHEGPQTRREQMISGLCSWMCFAIATYTHPGSLASWGKTADEMDDSVIDYLNGPGDPNVTNDEGLGQLLRMTRCEDLGILDFREPMLAYLEGRSPVDPWGSNSFVYQSQTPVLYQIVDPLPVQGSSDVSASLEPAAVSEIRQQ